MENKILVFQSDFGLVDGAVAAMYGVSKKVDMSLEIHNLTHDIPQFNIWEASFRLYQTINYWPEETVFVSVVDPGVGSSRRSVVAKTSDGKYVVTPDNGTLTHLKNLANIIEVREIDETLNRLPGSEKSHTFHGRDVYAYTGARLASGKITFEEVGRLLEVEDTICLPIGKNEVSDGCVLGCIDILDTRYGSLWTNISLDMLKSAKIEFGDHLMVKIYNDERTYYNNIVTYDVSFAKVNIGEPIIYINSVLTAALAINQGDFSKAYNIGTGQNWKIKLEKLEDK